MQWDNQYGFCINWFKWLTIQTTIELLEIICSQFTVKSWLVFNFVVFTDCVTIANNLNINSKPDKVSVMTFFYKTCMLLTTIYLPILFHVIPDSDYFASILIYWKVCHIWHNFPSTDCHTMARNYNYKYQGSILNNKMQWTTYNKTSNNNKYNKCNKFT